MASVLTVYDKSVALIPKTIVLDEISVDGKDISFSGTSEEATLAGLVSAFQDSKDFVNVSVNSINKESTKKGISFSFKATYGR